MGCLSEQAALLFVERDLSVDETAAVKHHIDDCAACRELISELAKSLFASHPQRTGDGDAEAPRVGRYVLREVIGTGAMGIVYAGHDPELDRPVAVKILLGRDGSDAEDRLQREAQAMARLSHPNVVTVHDVGSVDGRVFVAMELVRGRTLAAWLAEAPRSWSEILEMFVLAGRGLAAAHEAHIVHRDFKPDNVLVGDDGRVRVSDFGLARSRERAEEPEAARSRLRDPSLTRSGVFVGTPAYMAPEQFDCGVVDARTDQFAFCVALYHALFGRRPFDGDTFERLAESVRAGRVNDVAERGVPDAIRRAVMRGLSRDPAERWPSMTTLREALEAAGKPRRRLGRILALVTAVLCVVAVGVGLPYRTAAKVAALRDARSKAVAAGDFAKANALSGELVESARESGDKRRLVEARAESGTVLVREGRLRAGLVPLNQALAGARELGDPELQVAILEQIAQALTNLARFDAAEPFYAEAKRLLAGKGKTTEIDELTTSAAVRYLEQLDLDTAERTFTAGLAAARRDKDTRGEGYALAGLGAVYEYRGDLAAARGRYEQWLTISLSVELGSLAKVSLTLLAIEEGRFEEAEELARASAEHFEGAHATAVAAYASSFRAWAVFEQGRLAEATDIAARADAAVQTYEVQRLRHSVETIAAFIDAASADPSRAERGRRRLDTVEAEARATGTWRAVVWAKYARARAARAKGDPGAAELAAEAEREAKARGLLVVAHLVAATTTAR